MRDKLLLETPPVEPIHDSSGVSSTLDIQITSPTPPLRPSEVQEQPQSASSRRRSSVIGLPTFNEGAAGEHAWDSVWPTPGVVVRPYLPEPGPSRFPIAPISPFVTPSFTPAAVPPPSSISKPPASPPSANNSGGSSSPHRFSPHSSPRIDALKDRFDGLSPDRGSLASPPAQPKHKRSGSLSSPLDRPASSLDRFQRHDAHPSPPRSPRKSVNQLPPAKPPDPRPTTPEHGLPMRRQLSGSALIADLPVKAETNQIKSKLANRPRGHSITSRSAMPMPMPIPTPPSLARADEMQQPSCDPIAAPVRPQGRSNSLGENDDNVDRLVPLPPPAAGLPVVETFSGRDSNVARVTSPPLFAPLARPATLRRALSDYDAHGRPSSARFHRTLSGTAEIERSPKRSTDDAELPSPSWFTGSEAPNRQRKSPRTQPIIHPLTSAADQLTPSASKTPPTAWQPLQPADQPYFSELGELPDRFEEFGLVDEGDILPTGDFDMDVTFDDEGLNQLERIFLLSKSDYAFHRAYVARMLGELLDEVDPCESVEYVLPLLMNFSIDEDESVKEAFAGELHKVLWYFYSHCRLVDEDDQVLALDDPAPTTITVTSEGLGVVPTPTDAAQYPYAAMESLPPVSLNTGQDPPSAGSSMGRTDTVTLVGSSPKPAATPHSISERSDDTAFSTGVLVGVHAEHLGDTENDQAKPAGPLCAPPKLSVEFFTPLLGSLLLNPNPAVCDAVRQGLVAIMGRLRRKDNGESDMWKSEWRDFSDRNERLTFVSQNGPHVHDLVPLPQAERDLIERSLLQGIIFGMGRLSVEMPEHLFEDDLGHIDSASEREVFHSQLVQEANAGRATSVNLIGAIAGFFSQKELVELGFVDELLRSRDGDEGTRAEGAVAMSLLSKYASTDQVYRLLPLFEDFLADDSIHVQQSVCLGLPELCKRIEDYEHRRAFASEAAIILRESQASDSLLEILGQLIYVFHDDPLGPPIELLRTYTNDSMIANVANSDHDWDVIVAYNFPGVCLTLGSDRWSDLSSLLVRVVHRAGTRVLTTIASFLHELAKILRPHQVQADLLPIFHRCLATDDEIRERIYEHLDIFMRGLPLDAAWGLFVQLAGMWNAQTLGGWRAREKLALHVPTFLELFNSEDRLSKVLDLTHAALVDRFACVRDAVTQGVPVAYDILRQHEASAGRFRSMILDLADSSSFKHRVTFVRCIREFARPPPNRQAFEEFFLPFLRRLSNDVVDVRLALAQMIANLFVVGAFYEKEVEIPLAIRQLAESFSDDDAIDVRDTLSNIQYRLDKDREIEIQIPYAVHPASPTNRARVPEGEHRQVNEMLSERKSPSSLRGQDSAVGRPEWMTSPSPSAHTGIDPFAMAFDKAVGE